ncbi:MerR family transcriptional regulator [uncultured Roseovarius sp.]|uniref:MerR family transcriptional regulator n=1 Tax=uncultured Roseovarius sp. TaxID=293344 RepID=UPI002615C59A|nr:MerR family transcriptional regulator [uncultured Roseovarius sp.]
MAKSADAFRTISEVADWLETPAHVLRFWESKFSHVKPVKRAGGRRYYRPSDMLLLGGIKKLLHTDGMTIKGVQKLLREKGVKHVAGHSQPLDDVTVAEASDAALELPGEAVSPPEETVVDFQRGALKGTDQPVAPDEAAQAQPAEESLQEEEPPQESADEPPQDIAEEPDQQEMTLQEETADNEPAVTEDEPGAVEQEPANEVEAEPVAEIEAEADAAVEDESAKEEPEPLPIEEAQEETPDAPVEEPPVMPSFSHRPAQPEPEEEVPAPAAEITAPPTPKPNSVDLPDDPTDDIEAEPGVLTQIAALRPPISNDMADRLGLVLDRLRHGDDGNGPSQGS